MKENTLKAVKKYREYLQKNNLEEGTLYEVNYELKSFIGFKEKADYVKPIILIDTFEISPILEFKFYNKTEEVGSVNFLEPSLILDQYDKAAIKDDFEELLESEEYNIALLKKAIKKINLKGVSKCM